MKPTIAYFTNQYPKVSHTFIRREILALEGAGETIARYALRGWDEPVAGPEDAAELARTQHLLRAGALPLLKSAILEVLRSPGGFWRAARQAWSLGRRSGQSLRHLVYLVEACWLRRRLATQGISHVHGHFGTNPAAVLMLCRVLGGPSYSFTVHGPEEFDHPHELGLADKIAKASFVVAISSFGRSQLWRWLPHDAWPKVRVVHCGLDRAFRDAPPLPVETGHLVCVGRLCEQKGQLLLLQALAGLRQRGLRPRLTLAGDGPLRGAIDEAVQRLGLQDQVRVTGWVGGDTVRDLLGRCHAMVLPSFAEGLPVAIMEAMALGRPVVSTMVAGIPELVRHGEDGWLVPAGDVEALTEALDECLRCDGARLAGMGEQARQRVWSRHDVDHEAARLLAALDAARRNEPLPPEPPR